MNKYIFFLFSILFLSCQEDEHYQTTVVGRVIEFDTHQPIAGATVFMVKTKNSNSLVHFSETTSDANGGFTASFVAEKDYTYYAYATYNNYLFHNFVYLPFGQTNNINILLSKPGVLKVHVKNQNPFNGDDKLEIINSDYYFQPHVYNGTSIDSTVYITRFGNMSNKVYWKVTKNDSTIYFDSAFNFISLDTIAFDLFY